MEQKAAIDIVWDAFDWFKVHSPESGYDTGCAIFSRCLRQLAEESLCLESFNRVKEEMLQDRFATR